MIDVLESTRYVIENSRFVKINRNRIKQLAEILRQRKMRSIRWNYEYHFFDNGEKTCEYLFVLDSLNFCFWNKDEVEKWKTENGRLSGYFALAYALKKAAESGKPKLEADSILKLSYRDFTRIFAGTGKLLLLKRRFEILKENYTILEKKYRGSFVGLIDKCDGDAIKLASLLVKEFPSFRDEAYYNIRKIGLYKRAQILAGDFYCCFGNKKWGRLKNLEKLTAFPDYKIPQILRGFGILEYGKKLAKKVDNRRLLKAGGREEVEIRSATVWAVEFLKHELKKLGMDLKSIEIDWHLWNWAKTIDAELKPYHLTETIFY
jgi:hypothetical protein